MDKLMKDLEALGAAIDDARSEAEKFKGGNKSAGTRIRGKMQEIKTLAQDVRTRVLELRG